MLGTITTEDPDRARVAGFAIHLGIGQVFALFYAAGFAALDTSDMVARGFVRRCCTRAVALAVLVPLFPRRSPANGEFRAPAPLRRRCWNRRGCSRSTTEPRPLSSRSCAHVIYGAVSRTLPGEHLTMPSLPPRPAWCRSATTASSATLARPASLRQMVRSTGGACRASTIRHCSAGWSAATRPAWFTLAPDEHRRRDLSVHTAPTPPR